MPEQLNGKIKQGSVIVSPLLRRFLLPNVLTMLAFAVAVYLFAVPYIKDLVFSLEEKAVKTDLRNIHSLIGANVLAINAYERSVKSAHNRQLKNITLFTEAFLKNKFDQVQNGLISDDEAQWAGLEELRNFRYGKNDYVWVADYNGFYLSHPDPNMNMEDYSEVRDVFGNLVLSPLIQKATQEGEGYHSFWWQRLDNDLPAEKLTYAKLFPQWEWVIGTGVYLDDLETEILMRKEKMIEELRQILEPITVAKTGYMYVFDSYNNIIIHPDEELVNSDMSGWINPVTKNMLAEDLVKASHSAEQKLAYKWNNLTDKENFIYDKIDWVTQVEEFDWYVVASVYTKELNESSELLRNKILGLTIAVVLLSVIIVSVLMSKLLDPIRRLSLTASRVGSGDLSAESDVTGDDEIGSLARAFNSMVRELRNNIQELDQKVLARTKDLDVANKELSSTVDMLAQHNWEVTQLNKMAENLQSCRSLDDIFQVIKDSLSSLFHQASGVLYISEENEESQEFTKLLQWGENNLHPEKFCSLDCAVIRDGRSKLVELPNEADQCKYIQGELPCISICIPLLGQQEEFGVVSLIISDIDSVSSKSGGEETPFENWQRLSTTVSDQLSMAISNMKLQERLRGLSVRDGLTGLFNRRYMEETLDREFQMAERDKYPIGVIMLDVDFFKKFNDTHGHEAGDLVLVELAKVLQDSVRKADVVCRFGGEEFVVILPGPPAEQAIQRAESIRAKVEKDLAIKYQEHTLKVTISLGAAFYPEHGMTPDEVLKAADVALYKAKEAGRNRAVAA